MADPSSDRDPLEQLAEDFLARFRAGERPSLTEIVASHPELAEQIQALFPPLVEMEEAGSAITPATGPATPRAGDIGTPLASLGDYRIIREVGRGGMGMVYEAVQESLSRHVALKVFSPWMRADPKQIERFRREARAAARLHHTNIVPVFGVGEHDGHRYYAMQFIQGQGLDTILHELRRLRSAPEPDAVCVGLPDSTRSAPLAATVAHSLLSGRFAAATHQAETAGPVADRSETGHELSAAPRAAAPAGAEPSSDASHWASQAGGSYARTIARVGLQVAEALAHAHGRGILHRDIKPSNLLLDLEGNVWVTDFGLAKSDDADALTEAGDIVGTIRYMAPERFRGDSGPENDVYGLGVTLYELLTLRPAFDDGDRARLIDHILHTDPPPPRSVEPRIPRDLETIVLKAMARHPTDRYPSALALAEDLGRFLDDRTILARRSSASERLWRWCKRNPVLAALNAVAATLTIAIALISTVAAIWLGQSRNKAIENLGRATSAEVERTRQLWESSRAQARAGRFSHQVGQRFASLEALTRAAGLGVFPERKRELRDEAIACLALPDLQLERSLGVSLPQDFPDSHWIAFDGAFEHFAYSDRDGAITLRKVDTGEVLGHLPGPGRRPYWIELAFSPDGAWLVIDYLPGLGRYGPIVAWQVGGADAGRVVTLAEKGVRCRCLCPDGRTAVLSWFDGTVAFVDLASGREHHRLKLELVQGTRLDEVVRIAPDGRLMAYGDKKDRPVWLFDLLTGARVHRFELPDHFDSLAWSPDGQLLAASCDDRQIYIWETASKRLISVLEGHTSGGIDLLQFSRAGDFLLSRSWDGTTRLWDPIRGRERLNNFGGFVALSNDDSHVAIVNPLNLLEVHELAAGRECRALHAGRVGNRSARGSWGDEDVDFHADGRLLATAGDAVRVWDLATFSEIAQLPIGLGTVRFRPDGTSLLTFGPTGLRLWPLVASPGTGEASIRIGPPRLAGLVGLEGNCFARWDGSGRFIVATNSQDQQAVLLAPTTLTERGRFGPHAGLRWSIPSPDGRWVATSTWQGHNVKVWETASGKLAWELPCGSSIGGFSPDGRWLVTALDHEYRLWHVGSWTPGLTIRSGNPINGAFAFTRDGGVLAVDRARRVLLVDPESGRELAILDPPPEYPTQIGWLCFSPDDGLLAVTGDQEVLVWDLRLIRAHLAAMGLDWDAPPIPAAEAASAPAQPVRVRVEGADGIAEAIGARDEIIAGHWEAAAAGYARAVGKGADDPLTWQRHLLFRLRAGDLAGYRAGCGALISRFGGDERPGFVAVVAWTCAIGPDALADCAPLLRVVQAAVTQRPENAELRMTLGAVLVRAGRAREAVGALEESVRRNGHGGSAYDWLFLALAHHRLGQADAARAALAKAADWIAHGDERALPDPYVLSPLPWYTKLELESLLREADDLISRTAGDLPVQVFAPW